jgi:hypothetical protein
VVFHVTLHSTLIRRCILVGKNLDGVEKVRASKPRTIECQCCQVAEQDLDHSAQLKLESSANQKLPTRRSNLIASPLSTLPPDLQSVSLHSELCAGFWQSDSFVMRVPVDPAFDTTMLHTNARAPQACAQRKPARDRCNHDSPAHLTVPRFILSP